MDRRLAIKNLAAGALLVSAWALLTACQPDRPNFHGIDITGVDYARDLRVRDFNGQPRTLADFRGKTVVLEWTNDGCPFVKKHYTGAMQALSRARSLGEPAEACDARLDRVRMRLN